MKFNLRRRLLVDLLFFILSLSPAISAFITDFNGITDNLFSRCGAIMAFFAAFLEFRTHEIQMYKERDQVYAVWRSIGVMYETIEKSDHLLKWIARQVASLIQHAGMYPEIGNAEDIKNIILSDETRSLKLLPNVPDKFYKYNTIVSIAGKVLVIIGTLIWAFGDLLVTKSLTMVST